jgi:pimeloyl-ACP methyl ester carboxylesterase
MHGDQSANFDTINSLGGIQTICIPDSGHFPMVDNPDKFCHAIASFLGENE